MLERLYEVLRRWGYPEQGLDWLRRHRLPIIVAMALLSWALFVGVGWLIWSIIGALAALG
ncbi:hypothetical protein [Devosia sp. RR2S18]|uniref:hypothetical protein n=1 Tax=Devosia rhizosphaerae TaxID=3049774 RepID=UPI00254083CC|nr:hypothetical protein [Devosia sp. RR2S18]WIJ23925.1 hypothetical protein QOV41_12850 [Devosia sp. RR2S18]